MTQVKQITMFQFSSTVGETTYNFSIPAESQSEACTKLTAALTKIVEEVKAMAKLGPN